MTPVELQPLLHARDLQVGFRHKALLPPLALSVRQQEFWAIVGRNGSGKTTLLRTLLRLMPCVGGSMVWQPHALIGYIPQRSEIDLAVPTRVIDLVQSGAERGWSFLRWHHRGAVQQRTRAVLEEIEIAPLAYLPFARLSEGQKQRVLIARALVTNPNILILDEPTAAMDVVSEHATFACLEKLRHQRGLSVMIVAHHITVLAKYVTHMCVLDRDLHMAETGTLRTVANLPNVVERYGRLFNEAATR